MNLRIAFKTFDDRAGDEVAAEEFVLDHHTLAALPDGRVIATQTAHEWRIEDRTFVRFECTQDVMCLFERQGKVIETYGAYGYVTCVDGVLWAHSNAIAHLKDRVWISLATNAAWPNVRLAAAHRG